MGKYIIRPVLSLKWLFFDETAGKVCYQYSRDGSQEELMDYLKFITRVTSHIPDKGQVPLEGEPAARFPLPTVTSLLNSPSRASSAQDKPHHSLFYHRPYPVSEEAVKRPECAEREEVGKHSTDQSTQRSLIP